MPAELAEYQELLLAERLYLDEQDLVWAPLRAGASARVPIEGAPSGVQAYVAAYNSGRGKLNLSLVWNGVRLFGFDEDGPSHTNLAGKPIPTPHRQYYLGGQHQTDPVDLQASNILSMDAAWRWFVDWCEIPSGVRWTAPPPVQLGQPSTPARVGKSRRRRR